MSLVETSFIVSMGIAAVFGAILAWVLREAQNFLAASSASGPNAKRRLRRAMSSAEGEAENIMLVLSSSQFDPKRKR
jgi:hypothetical protein